MEPCGILGPTLFCPSGVLKSINDGLEMEKARNCNLENGTIWYFGCDSTLSLRGLSKHYWGCWASSSIFCYCNFALSVKTGKSPNFPKFGAFPQKCTKMQLRWHTNPPWPSSSIFCYCNFALSVKNGKSPNLVHFPKLHQIALVWHPKCTKLHLGYHTHAHWHVWKPFMPVLQVLWLLVKMTPFLS